MKFNVTRAVQITELIFCIAFIATFWPLAAKKEEKNIGCSRLSILLDRHVSQTSGFHDGVVFFV